MISTKNIFSALLLTTVFSVQAQTKKIDPVEAKGNTAYASLLYADALMHYKQVYKNGSTTEVAAKIADCYWLLRNYDSAYVWYSKLPQDRLNANKQEKVRLAELTATMGQYQTAATTLKNVQGYAPRANGFTKTAVMVRDSAQWNVQYLAGINTNTFREFSPVLVDSGLIWTTNQPKTFSQNGIMGWDKMGYNRLMKVNDLNALAPQALQTRQVVDRYADSNRPNKLAKHYTLADVDLLSTVSLSTDVLKKLKSIQKIATPIVFENKVLYNIAHATTDLSGHSLFVSVNQQGKIKNAARNLSLASGTLNGAVVSSTNFVLEQNASYSNMHPAIHPNGNIVVFSSNREGGKGAFDLYLIQKGEDGKWTDPRALNGVNTVGNELFPSFGADGKFYFSSDALPGLGGLDIFVSALDNGSVKNIRHLSYPVNSAYDDFGLTIMEDGSKGYFSSDRLGTDDIYMFEKATNLVLITGKVNSAATKTGKPGVEVAITEKQDYGLAVGPKLTLTNVASSTGVVSGGNKPAGATNVSFGGGAAWLSDLGQQDVMMLSSEPNMPSTNSGTQTVKTDANGIYSFWAKPNRSYDIVINDGSSPKETVAFNTYSSGNKGDLGMLAVNDIVPEKPTPVFDARQFIVYFAFDKADIRKQYADTLDQVIAVLKANPEVACVLGGHTDQYGKDKYNDDLSDKRVVNVKAYLEAAGISANRITIGSYGEKQLVQLIKNKRKAEINRRVEISLK